MPSNRDLHSLSHVAANQALHHGSPSFLHPPLLISREKHSKSSGIPMIERYFHRRGTAAVRIGYKPETMLPVVAKKLMQGKTHGLQPGGFSR